MGEEFVRHGGYNEVGDLNNIIILYPQVDKRLMSANPEGCWDWWGYTGLTFGKSPLHRVKRHIFVIICFSSGKTQSMYYQADYGHTRQRF